MYKHQVEKYLKMTILQIEGGLSGRLGSSCSTCKAQPQWFQWYDNDYDEVNDGEVND